MGTCHSEARNVSEALKSERWSAEEPAPLLLDVGLNAGEPGTTRRQERVHLCTLPLPPEPVI